MVGFPYFNFSFSPQIYGFLRESAYSPLPPRFYSRRSCPLTVRAWRHSATRHFLFYHITAAIAETPRAQVLRRLGKKPFPSAPPPRRVSMPTTCRCLPTPKLLPR